MRPHHLFRFLALSVLVVASMIWGASSVAGGGTTTPSAVFTVTNGADTGPGSYRAAIEAASAASDGPDVITFDAGLTVTLADDVAYTGSDALTITGNGSIIDGGSDSQILEALDASSVTIDGLTLRNGETTGKGGAIEVDAGDLTVTNSTLADNTAALGGAIGDSQAGTIEITASTLTGNKAETGDADGGAISATNSAVLITNTTLTGNTAGDVGGAVRAADVRLVHATIASNTAPGSQIDAIDLTAFASVLSDPLGGAVNCDAATSVTSNGFNYSTDSSCGFTSAGDTEDGNDPGLGSLGSFGGPTPVRPPSTSSPLVDAVDVAECAPGITTDQRGQPRPADADGDGVVGCDIGAVEVQLAAAPTPPDGGDPDTDGPGDEDSGGVPRMPSESPAARPAPASPTFTG